MKEAEADEKQLPPLKKRETFEVIELD